MKSLAVCIKSQVCPRKILLFTSCHKTMATGKGPVPGERKSRRTLATTEWPGVTTGTSSDGKEKFTFFFGAQTPFSQFHSAEFEVDGQTYNCAEQFMMHQKAVLFKDAEMAKKILDSTVPKEQKAFGRKVSNFDAKEWGEKCRDVVKKGNRAKFSQNEDLLKALLDTQGTTLVEASPRDTLWGIGLGAKNEKAVDRSKWRGKNWLGNALTEVREELNKEQDSKTKTRVVE